MVIGRSRVKVLDIIDFTRVLEKRTLNLTIQSHMFNITTNFTWGRGTRIHNINIYTVQPLSHSINLANNKVSVSTSSLPPTHLGWPRSVDH